MKIYELIRQRSQEVNSIEKQYNREILKILKQWFPEYEIDFSFSDVTFTYCNDYWCRFALHGAETYKYGDIEHKSTAFRLSKNNGLTKEEIKSIKDRLSKLYEGAYGENE